MRKTRRSPLLPLLIAALVVALFCGALFALKALDPTQKAQARDMSESSVGKLRTMTWNGQTYVERTDVTTLLVIGTDVTENTQRISARSGGQADFLMLVVFDGTNREIRQLAIDRDTIASVQVRGILGELVNRADLQICLSHGYGRTDAECNENTVDAVSNLLLGEPMDGYVTMNLGDVQRLNAALGGVTVTLEDDDLAVLDPAMRKGATLRLTDQQAEYMVHVRMTVGDGQNTSRMRRQAVYLRGAVQALRQRMADTEAAEALYLELEPYFQTDLSRGQLINLGTRAAKWAVPEAETLGGEHTLDEQGFVAFYPAEGEIERWLAENLFEPK